MSESSNRLFPPSTVALSRDRARRARSSSRKSTARYTVQPRTRSGTMRLEGHDARSRRSRGSQPRSICRWARSAASRRRRLPPPPGSAPVASLGVRRRARRPRRRPGARAPRRSGARGRRASRHAETTVTTTAAPTTTSASRAASRTHHDSSPSHRGDEGRCPTPAIAVAVRLACARTYGWGSSRRRMERPRSVSVEPALLRVSSAAARTCGRRVRRHAVRCVGAARAGYPASRRAT